MTKRERLPRWVRPVGWFAFAARLAAIAARAGPLSEIGLPAAVLGGHGAWTVSVILAVNIPFGENLIEVHG